MGAFNAVQRKVFSARAAELLREDERYDWVRENWFLINRDDGEYLTSWVLDVEDEDQTVGQLRQWLREWGIGARNKKCQVCAEGALLLAMAQDETISDDVVLQDVMRDFNSDALQIARERSMIEEQDTVTSLYELNDDVLKEKDAVIDLLDRMGRP